MPAGREAECAVITAVLDAACDGAVHDFTAGDLPTVALGGLGGRSATATAG